MKEQASVLEQMLISVAQEFENNEKFQNAAQQVAKQLEFETAKHLVNYFHNTPAIPEELKGKVSKYGLLGVWMDICQDGIFEIFFNYKEAAIPLLYRIGFGVYDWTQYKAITILCRLAQEDIQANQIINDIGKQIHSFRYEAIFPSIRALSNIKNKEKVAEIILHVFDTYSKGDPIDGLYLLQYLAVNYPERAKEKLGFIKSIAKGKGTEGRSPMLDGEIGSIQEDGTITYHNVNNKPIEGNFNEKHQINAAILFGCLEPNDKEINGLLDYWVLNAKDEVAKMRIKKYRSKKLKLLIK